MAFPPAVLAKFILGFQGEELPQELVDYLARGLAGVVIYPRNFTSVEGLCQLTARIRRAAGRPVLIGVDQEGGTKFSLPEPFTQWPSPAEFGEVDDPALTEQTARALARELRAAGCNLDFAPMLDLHIHAESPVTKGRSFGSDPQRVSRLGTAFARGLAAEGILSCAKHFPGHGNTTADPHSGWPSFDATRERLQNGELVPFAATIQQGVPMVMTAHIVLPRIDRGIPATLSRKILTALLRKKMGFDGVILADDIGMKAVSNRCAPGEAACETFRAGSDLAMACHNWATARECLEAVTVALEKGTLGGVEWKESARRIGKLLARSAEIGPAPDRCAIGCAEHRALVQEVRWRLEA